MIIQPEKIDVEYKTASGGRLPKDIWKTVVAFANADGGTIYFGVSPDGKEIKLTRQQADQIQRDIINLCHDGTLSIQFAPTVKIIGPNRTVVALIPAVQAALRPVYAVRQGLHKGTYIRAGSANIQADKDTISRFLIAAQGGAEQIWYPENYLRVLDIAKLEQYVALLNQRHDNVYQNYSLPEIIIKQHVTDKKHKQVSLFGLLAFGKGREPQDIVSPNLNLAVTQYAGTENLISEDLGQTYQEDREFDGDIVSQFMQALNYIKTKIPARSVVNSNGQREIRPAIPELALRESLANALVHRDYSVIGAKIQVNLYSNRIEIINPGASLIPIDQLDTAPSLTRNPLLMNYLKEQGIVEQKGRGIRAIYRSIRDQDLTEPTFENLSNQSFRVTLYNTSALSDSDREFLAQLAPTINRRQKNAVIYAQKHSTGISNSEYRQINDMQSVRDDKKANKELNQLVKLGILATTGVGRWRRYLLHQSIVKRCL